MLQRLTIALMFMFSLSSVAFAGIIGVGGSTTLSEKVKQAEEVSVHDHMYRRLNSRLSTQGTMEAEITNNKNQKERAEFMKVYVNSQPCIVEKNFRMKLKSDAE